MIKLGVIGCGHRVYGVIKREMRKIDQTVLVTGVVDPDESGVRSRLEAVDLEVVKFYPSVKELVESGKVDALIIGTRCEMHASYACEAAKYKLPLFMEKPIATNMADALKLEEVFRDNPCPTLVSFPLRVSPLCELARRFIQENRIGTPEHITALNYVPYGVVYFEQFYRNYANTQGLFLQKATHDLDYMSMLMDSPIVRVAAMNTRGHIFGGSKAGGLRCSSCPETGNCLESPEHRLRNRSGATTDHWCLFSRDCGSLTEGMNEDSSSALIEFASGAHGVYTQVFYSRRDAGRRGAIISGYGGTVDFDWYQKRLKYFPHHGPFNEECTSSGDLAHFGGDFELARDFIELIKHGTKPRCTVKEGLQSLFACLAAKESAATGQFVEVHQLAGF